MLTYSHDNEGTYRSREGVRSVTPDPSYEGEGAGEAEQIKCMGMEKHAK